MIPPLGENGVAPSGRLTEVSLCHLSGDGRGFPCSWVQEEDSPLFTGSLKKEAGGTAVRSRKERMCGGLGVLECFDERVTKNGPTEWHLIRTLAHG